MMSFNDVEEVNKIEEEVELVLGIYIKCIFCIFFEEVIDVISFCLICFEFELMCDNCVG